MSLHDSDAYIIEANTAAQSLPDPATVSGRTHRLHNDSNAIQVWSSVGATPFIVGGANSATLSIPAGGSVEIVSNGTRWASTGGPTRTFYADAGVTDAAGNVTFTFPVGTFAVPPIVVASYGPLAASNAPVDVRLTAVSAASATFNVRQAAAINVALIGLTVLVGSTVLAGVQVTIIATTAGTTP